MNNSSSSSVHVGTIKSQGDEAKSRPSHPVVCGGDHQSVWYQDGSFGLLDVSDGHHWDGDLGRRNSRMNSSTLQGLVYSLLVQYHSSCGE